MFKKQVQWNYLYCCHCIIIINCIILSILTQYLDLNFWRLSGRKYDHLVYHKFIWLSNNCLVIKKILIYLLIFFIFFIFTKHLFSRRLNILEWSRPPSPLTTSSFKLRGNSNNLRNYIDYNFTTTFLKKIWCLRKGNMSTPPKMDLHIWSPTK